MSARRGQRGSAAVLTTVLAGALVAVALGGAAAGSLLVGQRRAAAAADLAALAGADVLGGQGGVAPASSPAACSRAGETAAANGAVLTACEVVGRDLLVSATVEVAGPFGSTWPVAGTARAGPATAWGGPGP